MVDINVLCLFTNAFCSKKIKCIFHFDFWFRLLVPFKTWEYIYIYIYFVEILIYKSRRYDSSLSLRKFLILWYKYLIVFEKAFFIFETWLFCMSLLILRKES